MKISFINEVANIAEAVGANIVDVRKGIGSDSRIGLRFLFAGIAYGGSCFPKDVAAFQSVAREYGYQFHLLDEVRNINEEKLQPFLKKFAAPYGRSRISAALCWVSAFKSGTDDVREPPAIQVVQALLKEGCQITAFDPAAMERARAVLGDSIAYASDPYSAAAKFRPPLCGLATFALGPLSNVAAVLKKSGLDCDSHCWLDNNRRSSTVCGLFVWLLNECGVGYVWPPAPIQKGEVCFNVVGHESSG